MAISSSFYLKELMHLKNIYLLLLGMIVFVRGNLAQETTPTSQDAHHQLVSPVMSVGPVSATKTDSSSSALEWLKEFPLSGKAREAGFDGKSVMETTGIDHSLILKCLQANRGLIMLNETQWIECGGKPVSPTQLLSE